MRVTVSKTIHETALAFDAGIFCTGSGAHRLATAADSDVGIGSLGYEPLVFIECLCVYCSADEIAREIMVADGTEPMEVSIVDFRDYVCSHTLHTNISMTAARQRRSKCWSVIVAAYHADKAWLRPADHAEASPEHVDVLPHRAAVLVVRRGGGGGSR